MPPHPTKRSIEQRCKDLCDRLGLAQVYVAQVVGRRRHYLAGHGDPLPGQAEQMSLGPHFVVFWHGNLSESTRKSLKADLQELTAFFEEQAAAPESPQPERDNL
jgi:hypothetical protein